jgi:protoporphyrinogen oxidase
MSFESSMSSADHPLKALNGQHVGILGGGITGLTAAFYLLRAGARVTLVEARTQLGGLAGFFNFGPFHWDKFYHCILTSDRPLLKLIEDLGLGGEMRWTATKVGFFTNDALHSMSSTLDFLRFPALSLWEKFRLGLGIIYASRIHDGRALESIPVADWLIRIFGRGCYEKMWRPLLKCKLGGCREEASAAFIWATIFRLYSTREKGASQKERLGYVRGGYHTVITRLITEIERMEGKILTGLPVEEVRSRPGGGIEFLTANEVLSFDHAIATAPSKVFAALVPELSAAYVEKLKKVKYLGVVCVVLLLKRQLTPFYCTNLTDESLPFTGLIEMTNLISLEETQGRHLFYLPKYTVPGDPLFEATDEGVWEIFSPSLRKIFPHLEDSDIERRFVFRERLVQPVPVLHYSDLVPEMETNVPGLLLANTTQIINSTLNNNEMVKIANRAVQKISGERARYADRVQVEYAGAKQMAPVSGLSGDPS